MMTRKKTLTLFLTLILLTGLLAGCAASKADSLLYAADMEYKTESADTSGIYDNGSYSSTAVASSQQKLIKTVQVSTETEELNRLLSELDQQIAALGGYVEAREVQNGSSYSSSRSRWANLTVRVPVERLDELVSQVQGLSNVTDYNETVDDITLTYVDTESRRTALETEYDRLLKLLEQAENMADLLEIESRMTEVRYELETITGQLRVYDNKITYATVYLWISEVQRLTPVAEESVWQRIASGFGKSWDGLTQGLEVLLVFIVANSPYLIFLGLVAFAVVAAVLLIKKRKKNHKQKQENMES